MGTVTVFAGLDYHDAAIRVCVLDAQGHLLGNRDCPNDCQAIAHYVRRFGATISAVHVCIVGAAGSRNELGEARHPTTRT